MPLPPPFPEEWCYPHNCSATATNELKQKTLLLPALLSKGRVFLGHFGELGCGNKE